jgi:hypothetical protein
MVSNLLKPGVHFNVPREVYDADPGLNQSTLSDFIYAATPAHYKWDRDHPKDQDYLRIGNAIDCLVSTPSEFKERFPVAPETYPAEPKKKGDPIEQKPWTLNSNWCKGWWKSRVDAGLTPLTPAELERVSGMVDGLERHPDIPRILTTAQRQVCLIAIHPILGYRMKALLDVLPDVNSEVIYDLKSIGRPATPTQWGDQIAQMAYHIQGAFYCEIARYCGIPAKRFGWLVVESNPPHESAVYYYDDGHDGIVDEEITAARTRYTDAMPKFMACKEADRWPGHSTDWIKVKLKPWQLTGRTEDYERLT